MKQFTYSKKRHKLTLYRWDFHRSTWPKKRLNQFQSTRRGSWLEIQPQAVCKSNLSPWLLFGRLLCDKGCVFALCKKVREYNMFHLKMLRFSWRKRCNWIFFFKLFPSLRRTRTIVLIYINISLGAKEGWVPTSMPKVFNPDNQILVIIDNNIIWRHNP